MKDIIEIIVRKWVVILCVVLGATLLSAGVAFFLLPNNYTCSSDLYISSVWPTYDESGYSTHLQVQIDQQYANDTAELAKSQEVERLVCQDLGYDNLDNYTLTVTSATKHRIVTLDLTGSDPENITNVMASYEKNITDKVNEMNERDVVQSVGEIYTYPYPTGPNRTLIIALTFVISLFVVITILLIIKVFDTSISSREDIEDKFGIKMLAVFPE